MARRRRDSSDVDDQDATITSQQPSTAARTRKPRTVSHRSCNQVHDFSGDVEADKDLGRRSRRLKKLDDSDDEDDSESTTPRRLVPKRKTPSTAQRQIRLLPLSTLGDPHNAREILPRKERLARRPPRRFLQTRPSARLTSFLDDSDASSHNATMSTKALEDDSWADLDAEIGSTTDDDIPSPSAAAAAKTYLRARDSPRTSVGPQDLDLVLNLKALSIYDDEPWTGRTNSPKPSLDVLAEDDTIVAGASDKENTDAVIRFSPPRLHTSTTASREKTSPPVESSSKSRLPSPSKRQARIPSSAMRPSLDAFWTAETVNDWNDQYSPKKVLVSPRKARPLQDQNIDPTPLPRCKLSSPTKTDRQAKKDFDAAKHIIAAAFLAELDEKITSGQIAELAASTGGVQLVWSKTLATTAGRANWRRERTTKKSSSEDEPATTVKHHASIELGEKVISDEHRLLNVLAHEFCHLANFMVSGIKDRPHGAEFQRWGRRCSQAFGARGVAVTTKHTYEIDYKYVWRCSNADCAVEFRRHSKSIDPARHTCGSCRSTLLQIRPAPRKNAGSGDADVGGYAGYVKRHFAEVRRQLPPGSTQKEVMTALGQKYRQEKAERAQNVAGGSLSTCDVPLKEVEVVNLVEDDLAAEIETITLSDGSG